MNYTGKQRMQNAVKRSIMRLTPSVIIRRRFKRGINNLIHLYMPICDSVLVYNNAHGDAISVSEQEIPTSEVLVYEPEMWNQLLSNI